MWPAFSGIVISVISANLGNAPNCFRLDYKSICYIGMCLMLGLYYIDLDYVSDYKKI